MNGSPTSNGATNAGVTGSPVSPPPLKDSPCGLIRWLKFNAVGAIGIAVQLAALALLKSCLGMNYLLATALAVEAAVLHNFVWHERFTWADRPTTDRFKRLLKFNLTAGLFSIAGNVAFTHLLVRAGARLSPSERNIHRSVLAHQFCVERPAGVCGC